MEARCGKHYVYNSGGYTTLGKHDFPSIIFPWKGSWGFYLPG